MSSEGQQETLTIAQYFRELGAIFAFFNSPIWILFAVYTIVEFVVYQVFGQVNDGNFSDAISVFITWPIIACFFHQYLILGVRPSLANIIRLPFFKYIWAGIKLGFVYLFLVIPFYVLGYGAVLVEPSAGMTSPVAILALIGFVVICGAFLAYLFVVPVFLWRVSLELPNAVVKSKITGSLRKINWRGDYPVAMIATLLVFTIVSLAVIIIEFGIVPFTGTASKVIDLIDSVMTAVLAFLVAASLNIFYKYWFTRLVDLTEVIDPS